MNSHLLNKPVRQYTLLEKISPIDQVKFYKIMKLFHNTYSILSDDVKKLQRLLSKDDKIKKTEIRETKRVFSNHIRYHKELVETFSNFFDKQAIIHNDKLQNATNQMYNVADNLVESLKKTQNGGKISKAMFAHITKVLENAKQMHSNKIILEQIYKFRAFEQLIQIQLKVASQLDIFYKNTLKILVNDTIGTPSLTDKLSKLSFENDVKNGKQVFYETIQSGGYKKKLVKKSAKRKFSRK
jgi:hypothetical protein